MPINLFNERALNDYLTDVIYQGQEVPHFFTDGNASANFKSPDYVEQHKDAIVKAILSQYIKHRMRAFLTDKADEPFLVPLQKREGLPQWAMNALANNKPVFEFDSSKMTNKMSADIITVRDFLYSAAESYIDKSLAQAKDSKKDVKISLDYLKTNNEYDTFEKVLSVAEKWHAVMTENAEKKAKDKELYEKSLKGGEFVMDLGGGMSAYRLTTPEALDFESEYMGHCVGKGGYDEGVRNGSIKIFSIRDENGEPHATLEVRRTDVMQCKGKGNKTPIQKYIPAIQKFVETQNLEIKNDMKNIGLIKQDGQYYSLYDLPKGFVVKGDLDLSEMDLTDIRLDGIKVEGKLDLSHAKNLPPELDLTGMERVSLWNCDLSKTTLTGLPTRTLLLDGVNPLPSELNLSSMEHVELGFCDLSKTTLTSLPTKELKLKNAKNLPSELDLSGMKKVDLIYCDLSNTTLTGLPTEKLDLSFAKNLPRELDLRSTKKVSLWGCDLSRTTLTGLPTEMLNLQEAKNLPPELDLKGVKEVNLEGCDLSKTKIIVSRDTKIEGKIPNGHLIYKEDMTSQQDTSSLKQTLFQRAQNGLTTAVKKLFKTFQR